MCIYISSCVCRYVYIYMHKQYIGNSDIIVIYNTSIKVGLNTEFCGGGHHQCLLLGVCKPET